MQIVRVDQQDIGKAVITVVDLDVDLPKLEGLEGMVIEKVMVHLGTPSAEAELQDKMDELATQLPDDLAIQHPEIYPQMSYSGKEIKAGTRVNWEGQLMKANVSLWDRADQTPEAAPELWSKLELAGGYRLIPDPIPAELTFNFGEIGRWTDGLLYKSIHSHPHAWTPRDYPAAWEVYTP